MPRVVAVTKTFVLLECEHVKAERAFSSFEEAKAYQEKLEATVCKFCGFARDAALRNPPLHMVCLHKSSRWWGKWLTQAKRSVT